MALQERRKFPRFRDKGLSLSLKVGDFDSVTHTLNISPSGVYCKVDKEIPVMSRVRLVLMLPASGGGEANPKKLRVEGIVVRQHPVLVDGIPKHYDVAIFFDNLPPGDRDAIAAYIETKKGG